MAMKSKAEKVQVSERAIFARLSRVMEKDGSILRRCREDSRGFDFLGRYYAVDAYRNTVDATKIDLEHSAREAGVLRDYEQLEASQ